MMNYGVLIGRLVDNPSIFEVDGVKHLEITLAVPRSYKNDEGVYETDFIPVSLVDKIAENTAEYCKKGDLVGVKGRIENIPNVRGENNLTINVEKITFLASKSKDE